jgi:hypothetical protein
MPSCRDHIIQAIHNEEFAIFLKSHLKYKDWLITASFYAAIHYIEALFFNIPGIRHSEQSIPTNQGRRYSVHTWRENLIRSQFPTTVYVNYRKLRTNSQIARYLNLKQSGTASDFFSDQDALRFLDRDLARIKEEIGFS